MSGAPPTAGGDGDEEQPPAVVGNADDDEEEGQYHGPKSPTARGSKAESNFMRDRKMKLASGATTSELESRMFKLRALACLVAVTFIFVLVLFARHAMTSSSRSSAAGAPGAPAPAPVMEVDAAPVTLPSPEEVLKLNPELAKTLLGNGNSGVEDFMKAYKENPDAVLKSLRDAGWTIDLGSEDADGEQHHQGVAGVMLPDPGDRADANINLVTTVFFSPSKGDPHLREEVAALAVNLLNPYIAKVHVRLESSEDQPCEMLWTNIGEVVATAKSKRGKLVCEKVDAKQTSYAAFFDYVKSAKLTGPVILAFPEMVFDESLGLLDGKAMEKDKIVYALAASTPPAASTYRRIFGGECHTSDKCVVGQFDGAPASFTNVGKSFPAIVFSSPLGGVHGLGALTARMESANADRAVAFALETSGQIVANPCKFVRVFNWHCQGAMPRRKPIAASIPKLGGVAPCVHQAACPGVKSDGATPFRELCHKNKRQKLEAQRGLAKLFVFPQAANLCCKKGATCDQDELAASWKANRTALQFCQKPDDTSCVIYDSLKLRHTVSHR